MDEPAPAPTDGGVVVEHATAVVKSKARPDLPRGQGGRFATKLPAAPGLSREPLDPPPSTPQTDASRHSGRRGGKAAATYRRMAGR